MLINRHRTTRVLTPFVFLDVDGYPTDELLQYVRNYRPDENLPVLRFVETVLVPCWWPPDCGLKLHRQYKGKRKLELHTGGWSGNEDIVEAIKSNIFLTKFNMKYMAWTTGGHYYFEIPSN